MTELILVVVSICFRRTGPWYCYRPRTLKRREKRKDEEEEEEKEDTGAAPVTPWAWCMLPVLVGSLGPAGRTRGEPVQPPSPVPKPRRRAPGERERACVCKTVSPARRAKRCPVSAPPGSAVLCCLCGSERALPPPPRG